MLEYEIEILKNQLNNMIVAKADFSLIYDVSTKLDKLIVEHYRKQTRK